MKNGRLSLTRRINESITLTVPQEGHKEDLTIVVSLAKINGTQATIAFEAPKEVNIVRNELLEKNY